MENQIEKNWKLGKLSSLTLARRPSFSISFSPAWAELAHRPTAPPPLFFRGPFSFAGLALLSAFRWPSWPSVHLFLPAAQRHPSLSALGPAQPKPPCTRLPLVLRSCASSTADAPGPLVSSAFYICSLSKRTRTEAVSALPTTPSVAVPVRLDGP